MSTSIATHTGNTFANGDSATATKLNAQVNAMTVTGPHNGFFAFDGSGNTVDGAAANGLTLAAGVLGLGDITPTSTTINGTTKITGILAGTASCGFGTVSAGGTSIVTVTITGAALGNVVSISYAWPTGIIPVYFAVTNTNTVNFVVYNHTGSGIVVGSISVPYVIFQF